MSTAHSHATGDDTNYDNQVLAHNETPLTMEEKDPATSQVEDTYHDADGNMIYKEVDVEPQIHWRTWVALIAVWLVNFTYSQTTAGPPALVSNLHQT